MPLKTLLIAALLTFGAACSDSNPTPPADPVPNPDPNPGQEPTPNPDPEPDPFEGFKCGEGASTDLGADGGDLAIDGEDQGDLAGLRLSIGAGVAPAGTSVSISCGDADIVPEGFVALSPPIVIDGVSGVRIGEMKALLPLLPELVPEGAPGSTLRIFVQFPDGAVRAPAFVDIQEDMVGGKVVFETHVFGTYQVAVAEDAGQPYERRHAYRAITGVSMGAGAAAMIGFRHPEAFDVIGALGGAADWTYLAHYIRGGGMGGFCPESADPDDPDTWKCQSYVPDQEFEHGMEFDDWFYSTGDGTGGTFDRESYQEIFQDLTFAFGNMGSYNPDNPYTPPGLTLDDINQPHDSQCPVGGKVIETGYFDNEYNPDGSLPVIAFCDGTANQDNTLPFDRYCDIDPEDGVPDQPNRGFYPGGENQRIPMEMGLAVDYNRNGMRDRGEPVIRNFWEPYDDNGVDGLADSDEPGYDAATNPDPAGDNYHWNYNPFGTEGNWRYDDGEPYEDTGLDGVADTPQVGQGGYDFGEGNGVHDTNPNLLRLYERNARNSLAALSEADRAEALNNTTLYADGGIRDLFNFAVSTNQLIGAVHGHGSNARVYDDFTEMTQTEAYTDIDVTKVDFKGMGEHVMVRYGRTDATEEDICLGDGKHVGEIFQTINRLLLMLGFITNRLPLDDKEVLVPPYSSPAGTYYMNSEALGGKYKYSIALPPGYETAQCNDGQDNDGDGLRDGDDPDCFAGDHSNEAGPEPLTRCNDGLNNDNDIDGLIDMDDPECESPEDDSESEFFEARRFPVVYVLHGYGQSPEDLAPSLLVLTGYMAGGFWPKAMLVFPDGFCGDDDVHQCNDGTDNDGDGLADRDDPDCAEGQSETGEPVSFCNDGVDNDKDGKVDLDDGGCTGPEDNGEADCKQGTFYSDHVMYPNGDTPGPPFEQAIMELVDHVDANYRTLAPKTVTVTPK